MKALTARIRLFLHQIKHFFRSPNHMGSWSIYTVYSIKGIPVWRVLKRLSCDCGKVFYELEKH